jgi:hypothetical protein
MILRIFCDPATGLPHFFDHGVTEDEVREVMMGSGEEYTGDEDSRIKLGQTRAGRYLKVIFVPDEIPDSVFVITAYDIKGKAKRRIENGNGGNGDDRKSISSRVG